MRINANLLWMLSTKQDHRPNPEDIVMGKKRRRMYEVILAGATEGLSGSELYDFTVERCPKAASGKIIRASMLAFSDPKVDDSNILQTISALAIAQRLRELGAASGHKRAKSKPSSQRKERRAANTASHTRLHHPAA
ncbi:hypothetical protein [Ensifer sp. M14]|jgi:hypothetical protein|uniref:hypothetical protein n=1 Tax=Ensifer sp. M14 TaxID=2203782 RepID=UPI0018F358F9|nr:hypothetical protein [Ensifer sp. M14]